MFIILLISQICAYPIPDMPEIRIVADENATTDQNITEGKAIDTLPSPPDINIKKDVPDEIRTLLEKINKGGAR